MAQQVNPDIGMEVPLLKKCMRAIQDAPLVGRWRIDSLEVAANAMGSAAIGTRALTIIVLQ